MAQEGAAASTPTECSAAEEHRGEHSAESVTEWALGDGFGADSEEGSREEGSREESCAFAGCVRPSRSRGIMTSSAMRRTASWIAGTVSDLEACAERMGVIRLAARIIQSTRPGGGCGSLGQFPLYLFIPSHTHGTQCTSHPPPLPSFPPGHIPSHQRHKHEKLICLSWLIPSHDSVWLELYAVL